MLTAENATIVLRQRAKLKVCVLKPKVSQLNLVHDFFTNLRIDRNVVELYFLGHFLSHRVLSRAKTFLVLRNHDELSFDPISYLLLGFAEARACICAIVTPFEEKSKCLSLRRVIVTLNRDLIEV